MLAHVGGSVVLPLYAGDDANDADALMAAAQLGGVAIGVGPLAPSTAQHLIPNPLALGYCLDALLKMLSSEHDLTAAGAEGLSRMLDSGV